MAKKTSKRRSTRRNSPRRSMGAVVCTRVGNKTVCKSSLSGAKRKSSKRKGGLAGKKRSGKGKLTGVLRGLGSVTCTRSGNGYNCRKA